MEKDRSKIDTFEIFEEIFEKEEQSLPPRQEKAVLPSPLSEDQFYEIEYDSGPFPGVGKYVLKSNKIEAPKKDEIRERFDRMRDIAREARSLYFNSSKFYDRKVQQENSRIFYKQGMFMGDFEDDFEKSVPYSAYYPGYQNMGYEQLRTYFTWRTKIRRGNLEGAALSYAFLYIYELLNNIGVKTPEEGLDRLMTFWEAFRVYDAAVDKYVPGWLKDYHIYYGLERPFREFVQQNGLTEYYPGLEDSDDRFDLLCSISKYDIRQSVYYTDGNEEMLREGFAYVMQKLEQAFEGSHIRLEEFIFQPTKNMSEWIPFKGALFYPHLVQGDRRVVLSKKEIYVCSHNKWAFNTALTTEGGKKLVGYVMKQMEAVLRKAAKYKYKLSAGSNMLSPGMAEELERVGISLEKLVEQAALEYYKEINRTIVKIDAGALERIRREALITQEKLTVPEQETGSLMPTLKNEFAGASGGRETVTAEHLPLEGKENISESREKYIGRERSERSERPERLERSESSERSERPERSERSEEQERPEKREKLERSEEQEKPEKPEKPEERPEEYDSPWAELGNKLNETEFKAVAFLLYKQTGEISLSVSKDGIEPDGKGTNKGNAGNNPDWLMQWESIKQFADAHGIMPEVLADGINEKSMDQTGDSLFDEDFVIYEDYIEQAKEMVEEIWQRRYLQE